MKCEAERCAACGRPVLADEMGISRKLINRGTTTYYCITCLAEMFEVREEDIRDKIVYFKKMGCTCFK